MSADFSLSKEQIDSLEQILEKCAKRENHALNEYEVYDFLDVIGIHTPPRVFVPANTPLEEVEALLPKGCSKFVAKVVVKGLTHKTEAKGVLFNILPSTAKDAIADFTSRFPAADYIGTLFVSMISFSSSLGGEILLSSFYDNDFGPMVCIGFGGTMVEELKENMKNGKSSLFLPASLNLSLPENRSIIEDLPLARIITGKARGSKKVVEMEEIINTISKFQYISSYFSVFNPLSRFSLLELEINPSVIYEGKFVALDGVLRCVYSRRADSEGKLISSPTSTTPFSPYSSSIYFPTTPLPSLPISLNPKPLYKISSLLCPSSVAIAGASSKNKLSPGSIITRKIKESKKIENEENIYIINPTAKEIEGIKCYPSAEEILKQREGKPVDLLVISIPAKGAKDLCELSFSSHFAESILIVTAGFAETEGGGKIQKEIENHLNNLSSEAPLRRPVMVGPNTLGFTSLSSIDTLFTPPYKSGKGRIDLINQIQEKKGIKKEDRLYKGKSNVAFISQSGANLISRISDLAGIVDPLLSMSVGNQLDLSATDFLEYLLDQVAISRGLKPISSSTSSSSSTSTLPYSSLTCIGLYIEGFNEGEGIRLLHLTRRAVSELNILPIFYKSGRSKEGRDAAKGHTASMAGDYGMFEFLLKSAGGVVCTSFEEFEDTMMMVSLMPSLISLKDGKKDSSSSSSSSSSSPRPISVGMMSNAGFEKCALADHLFSSHPSSITLPHWTKETEAKIDDFFTRSKLKGVVDISSVLDVTPMLNEKQWVELAEIILSDDNCDCGILSTVPESVQFKCLPKYSTPAELLGEDGKEEEENAELNPLYHIEDYSAPGMFLEQMTALKNKYASTKPFIVSIESGYLYNEIASKLIERGIPVFRRADTAAACLAKVLMAIRREIS